MAVVLVFTVLDSTVAVRIAYIFVTYNLFNTVLYTYVGMAHGSLATYITNNSEDRSQMLIFKMLFAALTQINTPECVLFGSHAPGFYISLKGHIHYGNMVRKAVCSAFCRGGVDGRDLYVQGRVF